MSNLEAMKRQLEGGDIEGLMRSVQRAVPNRVCHLISILHTTFISVDLLGNWMLVVDDNYPTKPTAITFTRPNPFVVWLQPSGATQVVSRELMAVQFKMPRAWTHTKELAVFRKRGKLRRVIFDNVLAAILEGGSVDLDALQDRLELTCLHFWGLPEALDKQEEKDIAKAVVGGDY